MTFAKLFVLAAASAILTVVTAAPGGVYCGCEVCDMFGKCVGGSDAAASSSAATCKGPTIPVKASAGGGCRPCTAKDRDASNKDGTVKYPQCVLTAKEAARAKRVAKRVADRRAKRLAMRKEDKIAQKEKRVKQAKVERKEKRVAARVAKAKADRVAARQAEKAWKGYGYTLVNSGTCGDAGAEIVTTVAECAYAGNFRSAGNPYQGGANVGTEYWHFGRPLNCMYGGNKYTWHDPDSIDDRWPTPRPHPNALCGSDGGSGTPFACICRVKLPPPHDGSPEPLSNRVFYNGHVYGTLANAAVDGPKGVGLDLCQQEYLPVPKGCRLAPNTEEILNNVVKAHTWSTRSLLLPDAEIGSIEYTTVLANIGSKGVLARDGANLYKPSTGCMQILYEC